MTAVGGIVGGTVLSLVGVSGAFALDGLTFLASAAVIAAIPAGATLARTGGDEHAATGLLNRAVHATRLVWEDADLTNLGRHVLDVGRSVAGGNADQHQEPVVNPGRDAAVHSDRRSTHALQDNSHSKRRPGL